MFTGLIEEVGTLGSARRNAGALLLEVHAEKILDGLKEGNSVAVNGVCLTVSRTGSRSFLADVVRETVGRTYLSRLSRGAPLNLERAMRADGRFGGHIVQGHVDGVGEILSLRAEGNGSTLAVRLPEGLDRYVVEKGSIALDGTSLTVASVERSIVRVALVPVTMQNTIFGSRRPGDLVHIEVDLLGKYVEKMLRREGRSAEWYKENGYG